MIFYRGNSIHHSIRYWGLIPTEIGLPTFRSDIVDKPNINQNQLLLNIDLAEETRQIAQVKLASYQQQAHNFYDKKVKSCSFVVGDWVPHRILTPQTKLQPNWEGPFEVHIGWGRFKVANPFPGLGMLYIWESITLSHSLYPKLIQFSDFADHIYLTVHALLF